MLDSCEYRRAASAAAYLKKKIGTFRPAAAAVLGSGLGGYAKSRSVLAEFEIEYSEIPASPCRPFPDMRENLFLQLYRAFRRF